MKKQGLIFTLAICVGGLYGSFLSWSVLQERINTKPYGTNTQTGEPDFFKAPLIINIIQAFFACIVGLVYSLVTTRSNPMSIFTKSDRSIANKYFKTFFLISITSGLSSPLGYESLKHVDYLAYLLAKSCKLIPVMLVHIVMYGTKFPAYKYAVALSVTFGVAVFTLAHSSSKSKTSITDGRTVLGMSQLIGSMLLDGLTNSTQDHLFKIQFASENKDKKIVKITGANLMCVLNLFVCVLTLAYTLTFKFDEITYTYNFMSQYPPVLANILEFAVFGSIGQVFVFIILEKFDSLILITATVTRKMISMILSVVLFGHHLNITQWFGVALVFGGIAYEALVKFAQGKKKVE